MITPDSSIKDLFDELRPEEGMRVVPVSLASRGDGFADLMIVISGKEEDANVMMANLMMYVDEMAAVAQQKAADSDFLGPDGRPVSRESKIITP